MLILKQVSKAFPGASGIVRAIQEISFAVQGGEFVAIQGPSGCGKTTLLLIAGGLLAPSEGVVELDGQNVYGLSVEDRARWRAQNIGFVFQQFHLIPYLSVLGNILVPSVALPSDDAGDRAWALIRRFDLEDRAHHHPAQLSTGERQRTALARALLNGPKLLLADEPTGNLDPANGEIILKSLQEFASGGGAVLLVTHDPAAVRQADRGLKLRSGKIEQADRNGDTTHG